MAIPSTKWIIALFVGVLIVAAFVLMIPIDEPETKPLPPAPAPSSSDPDSPDIAPSAVSIVDPQTWSAITELSVVEGDWEVRKGRDMAGAKFRIKKGGEGSLYPYSLRFEPSDEGKTPLVCGFYTRSKEGWRLAYCSGYVKEPASGSTPHKVMFHVNHTDPAKVKYLRVQIGNLLELYLQR